MVASSYALPDFGALFLKFVFSQHLCETHTEMNYNCRTECCVLLKPPATSTRNNQNGTLAKDALLMEKFISAESVR